LDRINDSRRPRVYAILEKREGGVKPNSLIEIYAYAVNYNTHCFELHLLRTNLGFRKA